MRRLSFSLVFLLFCGTGAEAMPTFTDPVAARIRQYCGGKQRCVAEQRQGIQAFLREITLAPRPTPARTQYCLKRATNRKGLTSWPKAARCIR